MEKPVEQGSYPRRTTGTAATIQKFEFCNQILNRAVLSRDHIECHFNIPALIEGLIPTETDATVEGKQRANNFSVTTPVQVKRCGLETRLVSGDRIDEGTHAGSIKAIRAALKNALRWNQALLERKVSTLTELARSENLDQRHLSDLIKLAYLAPDIQAAITKGTLHASVTLDQLKSHVPASWDNQRTTLHNAT